VGHENVPMLRKLNVRKNKIDKFDEEMPEMSNLTYLNLRGNRVAKFDELAKVFAFPLLTDVNIIGCPLHKQFTSFGLLVAEVLIMNPKLQRFCKAEITEAMKLEAVFLAKSRWEKREEARLKKEREEREREEAENAANNE